MTLTNIKTVIDRKGRARHYVQVKGKPLVRLPDAPIDSPDFLAAWAAAMKASTGHDPRLTRTADHRFHHRRNTGRGFTAGTPL